MLRRRDIDRLLLTMLGDGDVSDLNFSVGRPPQVERDGDLIAVKCTPNLDALTPYQTEMLALAIIAGSKEVSDNLAKSGSADCAYEIPGECRFRVNIFQQRQRYSIVLRRLASDIRSFDDLGLPPVLRQIVSQKSGLVLVTGATGSGKTTTLAAILNEMNLTRPIHVITLEDPIEFVHEHKRATFNQRELGTDFSSYASGLRAALRQAPKAILVGEMRDRETVEIGLAAASAGQLVLSTLHSVDCGQTISRIVGLFDKEEEPLIRARLAESLRWVINQRLVKKKGGGRALAMEIMGVDLRIRELVTQGESEKKTFYDVIGRSRSHGWMTHDQSLALLFERGQITEEVAQANASSRLRLSRDIDKIKQVRGLSPDSGGGLGVGLTLDNTRTELNRLLDAVWPRVGVAFPRRLEVESGDIEIGAPRCDLRRIPPQLNFPVRVVASWRGIAADARGELVLTAELVHRDNLTYHLRNAVFISLNLGGRSKWKQVQEPILALFAGDFQLRAPSYDEMNPEKERALARIAQEGDIAVATRLKHIAHLSTNAEERAALAKAIDAIDRRGR